MCTTTVAGKPCSASNLREQWTYGKPSPSSMSLHGVGRGASRGSPLGVSLVPREYFTRPKDGKFLFSSLASFTHLAHGERRSSSCVCMHSGSANQLDSANTYIISSSSLTPTDSARSCLRPIQSYIPTISLSLPPSSARSPLVAHRIFWSPFFLSVYILAMVSGRCSARTEVQSLT